MTAPSTVSGAIEIRLRFEPTAWQVAFAKPPQGSTFLLTWTVEPEPVDAGIPPIIQAVVADALCSAGPCWFAGDDGDGSPVATLDLRRALRARRASIFRADGAMDLLRAFESGSHDWSMAAQWIVVAAKGGASRQVILAVLQHLLESWELPAAWPADVSAIIQAGVDGDAAGCHCRTQQIERELRDALLHSAAAHGIDVRTID